MPCMGVAAFLPTAISHNPKQDVKIPKRENQPWPECDIKKA